LSIKKEGGDLSIRILKLKSQNGQILRAKALRMTTHHN